MSKRSLVIGMGIGQLYKTVLEKLGHEVITVDHDTSKGAMLPSVDAAILVYASFDTVQSEDEVDFDESAIDKLDDLEASVHDIT